MFRISVVYSIFLKWFSILSVTTLKNEGVEVLFQRRKSKSLNEEVNKPIHKEKPTKEPKFRSLKTSAPKFGQYSYLHYNLDNSPERHLSLRFSSSVFGSQSFEW